jgi:hypothetical protein
VLGFWEGEFGEWGLEQAWYLVSSVPAGPGLPSLCRVALGAASSLGTFRLGHVTIW